MNLARDLPHRNQNAHLNVIVETPKGASVKLKYDPQTNLFVWSRGLPTGTVFPGDFGFVPRTLAGDGDGLDAFVLGASAGYPGVLVPARVIGAIELFQTRDGGPEKDNHRLLTVAANEHRFAHIHTPLDLGERVLKELEAFLTASLAMTTKQIRVADWLGPKDANGLIATMHQRWNDQAS